MFEGMSERIDEVFKKGRKELGWKYGKECVDVIKTPKRAFEVSFPVKTSKGTIVFQGWRVQHNDALGPTKGGMRFHPQTNIDEVKSLAQLMSLKNSLMGLPYGGGKGGLRINPKEFNKEDMEKISKAFARALAPYIGERRDIPAPDVYTTPQTMAWFLDEYEAIKGISSPGTFTGKPIEIGGNLLRETATALGGAFVLDEYMKATGMKKGTCAIHGFGNAGSFAAEFLSQRGFKVIGVADTKGGIVNEKGFKVKELIAVKNEKGSVVKSKEGKKVDGEDILEMDADLLIPAALEDSINSVNASNVKANVILELANGPVTKDADDVLNKNGIVVLPDILANGGGVTVSYFEWVQNLQGTWWTREKTEEELKNYMRRAFSIAYEYVKKGLDYRTACSAKAIERILLAEKIRGRI